MAVALLRDFQLAARGLRRARGFTMTAVLTLAAGSAATIGMFALVEGVLLRPLPLREPERLVVAWRAVPAGSAHWPYLAADIEALRAGSRLLESVAGVNYNGAGPVVATENGSPSYFNLISVTGDFFDVLGREPLLGRAITRRDDVAGAENVLVITYAAWQRRYGGSRDAIGRRLTIFERPFTIVGVMPPGVEYPDGVEAWMSAASHTSILTNDAFRVDLDIVARMRPGVSREQVVSELEALGNRLETTKPDTPRGLSPVVRSFTDVVVGDVRPGLLVLLAAVALVFLVAGANVAILLLLRSEGRRSELAVRAALGASSARLLRELLAESVLLALAAGAVGLALAWVALPALVAVAPEGLPRLDGVRVDARVALFTTIVIVFAACLAGVGSALPAARADLLSQLRAGGRGATPTAVRRGRRTLVVTQVALALTIVTAAGALTHSLLRLQAVDMGLAADRLVFVTLDLPTTKYRDASRRLQFLNDAVEQFEAMPQIAAATPVNAGPFAGTAGWDALITAEGQTAEQAAATPLLNFEAIFPNYFKTFEVSLVRGRAFTDQDRKGRPNVAIVSDDLASRLWPGRDPLGKRITIGRVDGTEEWRTVVGVARPTRYRELREPRPTLYLPADQFIVAADRLVLRTTAPAAQVATLARERIRAIDPGVQVMRVEPFAQLLRAPLARPRFHAFLTSSFGLAALLLAAIGLYAVMAAYVRQRETEIGVRMALGATPSAVRRLVLREGLWLAGLGALIGVAITTAAARLFAALLFEVQPIDAASLFAAAVLLLMVAAVASYLPVRRAMRVDPIEALRYDRS
jgi:putative ABC transport system permease protein